MNEQQLRFLERFEKPDRAAWMALVEKGLKGASFERKLVTKTYDNIAIEPLYGFEDAASIDPGLPGLPPFTRGARASGSVVRGWDVRQLHAHPDPAVANAEMREDLSQGVTSILIRLDDHLFQGGETPNGVIAYDGDDFEALLAGIDLEKTPIMLDAGGRFEQAISVFFDHLERSGFDPARLPLDLGADPMGAVAMGRLGIDTVIESVSRVGTRPTSGTTLRVDGELYHAAGASEAQELGAVIATAIQYLRTLAETGMPVSQAAQRILFTLAADADIFLTIAKFRAARKLWARVLRSSSDDAVAGIRVHALSATRMLSERDPWTNLLRTTTAAFAAGIAGAESVTVLPFDHALGLPDAHARRLARDIQLVLIEESHLHRVIDPTGGSYHVERITDDLARRAWPIVQAIEGEGGMLSALRQGMIQDSIAETFMARLKNIATRKDPITGVSEYPNLAEAPRRPPEPDVGPLIEKVRQRIERPASIEPIAAPLRPMRLSQGFERLRDISDGELERTGARPRLFLCTIGKLAEYTTRESFVRNAVAAGGIEVVTSGPIDSAEAAAQAFTESDCRVACLCSSDERYAAHASDIARSLHAAGADAVLLAGRPRPELEGAGIDRHLYQGSNLLELLEDILSLILGSREQSEAS